MRNNMNNLPKEKADFGALKKILIYSKRYIPAIIGALFCAVSASVATVIGPGQIRVLMNEIVDGLKTEVNIDNVKRICFTLVIIFAVGGILAYGQQFITATVTQYLSKRLRRDIDEKINRLPLRFFDRTTKGDLLSRVTNDVDTVSQTLSQSTASLMNSFVLFAGVIFIMFKTNVILSVVTMVTSLVGFGFMGIILKKSQKYFNRKQTDLGVMNGQIEEVFTNHNIVHTFGAKKEETVKFNTVNMRLYDSNWKSQFLSGMMHPIMNFVGNLAYVLIFIIGVAFILNDKFNMDLGTISAFVIYARLFSQPLSTFAQAMTSVQQASAASRRIFEILESEEMENEDEKTAYVPEVKGNVEFKNVKFGYFPDKPVIKGFSASLKAGQKVAIVGPTGAGKTTIVNLLMRFYDVDSGDIIIDGVSVKDMKRETVHDLFDMILQDTWLFSGTVRDNLVYNQKDVPQDKLDAVCEAVGLTHFISTLSDGYDTKINDSLNISEGQKQQLTIARAMIKNSPLLILDEATSSVDTRTELIIQEAMDRLTKGRTSFIIAHRLSTVRNADIILVVKDGDIIEQGNHNELLSSGGFYAELYNSQFVQTA